MIHALHVLRPPFNTSRVSQVAAVAAIEDVGHLSAIIEQNRVLREEMESELLTRTECRAVDSSTNFLLILLGRPAAPVAKALGERGILVRTLEPYGILDAFRVTVGAREDNRIFLDNLYDILKEQP